MQKGTLREILSSWSTDFSRSSSPGDKLGVGGWELRWKLCEDIVAGMRYLHSEQIIHRDLKSDNCLVDSSFKVKVADFGTVARIKDERVTAGAFKCNNLETSKGNSATTSFAKTLGSGTPLWMAPEVRQGKNGVAKYSELADVFSFGIVMYEIGFLRLPYDDADGNFMFGTKGKAVDIANQRAFEKAVDEGARPEICADAGVPTEFLELMQRCWDSFDGNRPTFKQIQTSLINRQDGRALSVGASTNSAEAPAIRPSWNGKKIYKQFSARDKKRADKTMTSTVHRHASGTFVNVEFNPAVTAITTRSNHSVVGRGNVIRCKNCNQNLTAYGDCMCGKQNQQAKTLRPKVLTNGNRGDDPSAATFPTTGGRTQTTIPSKFSRKKGYVNDEEAQIRFAAIGIAEAAEIRHQSERLLRNDALGASTTDLPPKDTFKRKHGYVNDVAEPTKLNQMQTDENQTVKPDMNNHPAVTARPTLYENLQPKAHAKVSARSLSAVENDSSEVDNGGATDYLSVGGAASRV